MIAWLRRISPVLSVLAVTIPAGLSVWVLAVKPEKGHVVIIPAAVCIAAILVFEARCHTMAKRVAESHRLLVRCYAFFGGALVMSLGPGVKLAVVSGLLDASAVDTARRLAGVVSGVAFIVFGNFLPKLVSPWCLAEEPFDWQGVHRFSGRVFMLAGAAVVWVWLAWPAREAATATTVAFVSAAVLAVGRKFYSLATWRQPTQRS